MTTKKALLNRCFDQGLDIKAALLEARKKFGKCSRRTAEIAFKEWERTNISSPAQGKPLFSSSAKPQTEKPHPSDTPKPAVTSESTRETIAKDPDDLFIETPTEIPPEPAATEAPTQPPPGPQVSQTSQPIDVEGMVDSLSGLSVEELREMVKMLFLYVHTMPAQAIGVPASSEETKQLTILGKMLGLRYINDMKHLDLIFWGSILFCELAFWGCRVPAALDKMKELQGKMEKKAPAPAPAAAPA